MKPRWTGAAAVTALAFALLPMAATAMAAPLPAPVPSTPAAGVTVDQPLFTWAAVDGAVKYQIEVALDDQFVTVTALTDVSGTTYVPTYSFSAKAHFWHVRAVASDGTKGDWSATNSFHRRWSRTAEPVGTVHTTPGSRVTGLELIGGDETPPLNQIGFQLDPVAGASFYELQISTLDSFNDPERVMTCTTVHPVFGLYDEGVYVRRDPLTDPCAGLLPLVDGTNYYARVRAVDVPTAGDYPAPADTLQPIFGIWSDQQGEGDDVGPLTFTPSGNAGTTGVGQASQPLTGSGTHSDLPLLSWEPASDAAGYVVVIALDRDFTNVVGRYGTEGTYFVPPESYDDNAAGEAYYWYVLPCTGPSPASVCDTADRAAIDDDTYVWSFRKRSTPVLDTARTSQDGQANVLLTWGDVLTASDTAYPGYTSGGSQLYEIAITSGAWSNATSILTDNLAYSTAAADPLASGTYHWRVRPYDGQGVPLAWATGTDFTIVQPDDPDPEPSPTQSTPNPGSSTPGGLPSTPPAPSGPPPDYQAPPPDEGTATDIAPEKPGKPGVKRSGKRYLRVHWRASEELGSPVSQYLVYRSTNGSTFSVVKRTTSTTVRVKSSRKKTYWFYVVADSDAGRSERSATTKFPK